VLISLRHSSSKGKKAKQSKRRKEAKESTTESTRKETKTKEIGWYLEFAPKTNNDDKEEHPPTNSNLFAAVNRYYLKRYRALRQRYDVPS
jgi:hypothetical protein